MSHDYDFDPSDLDEFLVEYVDGTMDPVVREAFEEFMRVYPEVRAHVDCLASVRTKLCRLGDDCQCHAPPGFQDRLKRQLACEMSSDVVLENWTPQLNIIALAFSITILALAVGLATVEPSEEMAETRMAQPEQTVLPAQPLETAVSFEDPVESVDWEFSRAHQVSPTPSDLSIVLDRPMFMSVRRDLVAMKPATFQFAR